MYDREAYEREQRREAICLALSVAGFGLFWAVLLIAWFACAI